MPVTLKNTQYGESHAAFRHAMKPGDLKAELADEDLDAYEDDVDKELEADAAEQEIEEAVEPEKPARAKPKKNGNKKKHR